MEKIALIVAAGKGERMNSEKPKQFLQLGEYPVLMHTIRKFYLFTPSIKIVVVLPKNQVDVWKKLCHVHNFSIEHEIGEGGETRFHSVQRNVEILPERSLVAIHDGVRPLVSIETISRCFEMAEKCGNAVPCISIPETLRMITEAGNRQVDRNKYTLIQTPQVFTAEILKEAYRQQYRECFTDDAGVVENLGIKINLVEGNPENIKITLPKDLIFASTLLQNGKNKTHQG